MSETSAPAVCARLRVVGRALGRSARSRVGAAETVELVLTDRRTGLPVKGAGGITVTIKPAGRSPIELTDEDLTERTDGVWPFEVHGRSPGTWIIDAAVTDPRCDADRITLEFVA